MIAKSMSTSLSQLLNESPDTVRLREQSALDELLKSTGGRVVLFGAGSVGTRALKELRGIGINPLCFSDNNESRWGSTIDGCQVLSPADAAARYGADSLFLVTIWNAAHWYVETLAQLRSLGCKHISSYSPLFWRFPATFLPFLLNDLSHKVYEDADNVLAAEALWADQASLDAYRSHVRWYATGDASGLPPRPQENSYFPSDVFSISPDEVLVDCGAFDGDTIQQVIDRVGSRFKSVHAVEADPLSLGKLQKNMDKMSPEVRQKIKVHECAVGAERGKVRFETTGTVDSKICDEGGVEVDCTPMDELFVSTSVTMIKMDIEGAEYDALIGGRKIIQRDRPILAVCVYHLQHDLWRLPLLAQEMLPKHKFYLRPYEGDGFQTVLYAVPPDRVLSDAEKASFHGA